MSHCFDFANCRTDGLLDQIFIQFQQGKIVLRLKVDYMREYEFVYAPADCNSELQTNCVVTCASSNARKLVENSDYLTTFCKELGGLLDKNIYRHDVLHIVGEDIEDSTHLRSLIDYLELHNSKIRAAKVCLDIFGIEDSKKTLKLFDFRCLKSMFLALGHNPESIDIEEVLDWDVWKENEALGLYLNLTLKSEESFTRIFQRSQNSSQFSTIRVIKAELHQPFLDAFFDGIKMEKLGAYPRNLVHLPVLHCQRERESRAWETRTREHTCTLKMIGNKKKVRSRELIEYQQILVTVQEQNNFYVVFRREVSDWQSETPIQFLDKQALNVKRVFDYEPFLKRILERLSLVEIQTFRKVCSSIRRRVDYIRMDPKLTLYSIKSVGADTIHATLCFGSCDEFIINYKKCEDECYVNEFHVPEEIIYTCLNDMRVNTRGQKTSLVEVFLDLSKHSEIVEDFTQKDPEFYRYGDWTELEFFKVKKLTLIEPEERVFFELIESFEPISLEIIDIRLKDNEHLIKKLSRLLQFNCAKEVNLKGCPIRDKRLIFQWTHFVKLSLTVHSLSNEDVFQWKQILLLSPAFEKYEFELVESEIDDNMDKLLGVPYIDANDQQSKSWYYQMSEPDRALHILYHGSERVIFTKIAKEDVRRPTSTNVIRPAFSSMHI